MLFVVCAKSNPTTNSWVIQSGFPTAVIFIRQKKALSNNQVNKNKQKHNKFQIFFLNNKQSFYLFTIKVKLINKHDLIVYNSDWMVHWVNTGLDIVYVYLSYTAKQVVQLYKLAHLKHTCWHNYRPCCKCIKICKPDVCNASWHSPRGCCGPTQTRQSGHTFHCNKIRCLPIVLVLKIITRKYLQTSVDSKLGNIIAIDKSVFAKPQCHAPVYDLFDVGRQFFRSINAHKILPDI